MAQHVSAANYMVLNGQKQLHARHPAGVGSFGKVFDCRTSAGAQPSVEFADCRYQLRRVGHDLKRHYAARLAATSSAISPTVFIWSISSGRNCKPYSSSSASTRFRCCTESQLVIFSG